MRIARLVAVIITALVALTAVPATATATAQAAAGGDVTSPVSGRSVAATPLGCDGYHTPGSSWIHDQAFGNPTSNKFVPCSRCYEAKRRLEASGRFRGYCRDTTPGARADLYRYCLACRAAAEETNGTAA